MPEELGVERRDNDWIEIERAHFIELLSASFQEMGRVTFRCSSSGRRIVEFLLAVASSDAVIFDAREFANRRRVTWPEIFCRQLESDVAIEFAIRRIARITFGSAPDLPA